VKGGPKTLEQLKKRNLERIYRINDEDSCEADPLIGDLVQEMLVQLSALTER
jgi:hypothetical protein